MLTIREYLAITRPEVLAILLAWARSAGPPVLAQEDKRLLDITARLFEDTEVAPGIEKLMRHDAYKRTRGAIRQVRHA